MYQHDSFFTLSGAGQVGLLGVSIMLAAICIICVAAIAKRGWRVLAALVVFYGFITLSPQVYYLYYRVIIADLPQQWVIKFVPPIDVIWFLSFTKASTLSAHGIGLLGWALILTAVFIRKT